MRDPGLESVRVTSSAADLERPGLYVHVPFCSAICPYCDFSVLTAGQERRRAFVDSLLLEIERTAPAAEIFGGPFDTIYFGGGTPSALEPELLEHILDALRRYLSVAADAWIFFEANPEDVTPEALAAWRRLGVRTLSLGVQSFDAGALRLLGRRHDPGQSLEAVEAALAAGFDTVSFDLIYGLPEQRLEDWRRNLEAAAALAPQHLSCYQLTFHEGTPFGFRRDRGEMAEMAEGEQGEFFHLAHRLLPRAGLDGYEVSSFAAAPEHRSRHNRKYWNHTPYLGLGPSAHSFDGRSRWWNRRKLGAWQQALSRDEAPVEEREELTTADIALEGLMLGLRTRSGVDLGGILRRTGLDLLAANAERVRSLEEEGLLKLREGRLQPTLKGLAVADGLAGGFVIPA